MSNISQSVIIGGGAAGVAAALELDRLCGDDISQPIYLFDESQTHVYAPRLFEALNCSRGVYQIPFDDIFAGTRVRFLRERVVAIDFETKRVTTEKRQLAYGDVVVAVGCQTEPRNLTYEFKKEASHRRDGHQPWRVDDPIEIQKLKQNLVATQRLSRAENRKHYISVIGAGMRGVEAAFAVNAWVKKNSSPAFVTLIHSGPRIASELNVSASRQLLHLLKHVGVSVQTKKRRGWGEHIAVQPKKEFSPIHSAVWATGLVPRKLAQVTSLGHNRDGRVAMKANLETLNHSRVWAAGGCASIAESSTVAAAWRQGRAVARNIVASRQNKTNRPYQPKNGEFFLPVSSKTTVRVGSDDVDAGFWVDWLARWRDLVYLMNLAPFYEAAAMAAKGGRA